MSTEAAPDDPQYEVWVQNVIHTWHKPTISLGEIRELGGMAADSPVLAIDLVAQREVPLPEDAVHDVPARELGKPLIKRTHFVQLS